MSDADVLIVGCGYVGSRIGVREVTDGARVIATTRSTERFGELTRLGLQPCAVNLDDGPNAQLETLGHEMLVYYLVPPPGNGEEDSRARHFLASLNGARPRRIVLLSTTAVYGDCDGAWVDEDMPLNPQTARARRRADGEARFRQWTKHHRVPLAVLRVAGIYGPGRLPEARLQRAEPVLEPGASPYSNRIHADDLVRVCRAAARTTHDYRVYNVADGSPSNMSDYFFRVADALGLPRPPTLNRTQAEQALSAGMLSYLRESKRIDNARLREELGISLRYPDLESGLAHAIGGSTHDAGTPCLVICINRRLNDENPSCAARGSEALAARLSDEITRRGLVAELRRVYCLGRCEQGPNVRIVPGGKTYKGVSEDDIELLVEDLAGLCQVHAKIR
ncbi:MAG: NAD-dependent epimerase/dehydratase family protein [Gammaproteobacteria bacterium]|nr:NAD-dependent epimerase/dehydratase family protein [Gammaproteobacteria bacterium]